MTTSTVTIEQAHAEALQENALRAGVMVAAAAQVHGGTRIITLAVASAGGTVHTVTTPLSRIDWHVVTLRAYDSGHPGDELVVFVASDTDREALIAQAREFAVAALRPSAADEPCACWAGWDPYCGVKGCWGDYRHPLAALVATS